MTHMECKTIRWQELLTIPLFLLAATGVGGLFDSIGFPETNIVPVYVAAVLLVARFTHALYDGLAASVIATFAFNYFFTDPRFTFAVNDTSYLITFAIMMFTSLITSALTARVKKSAREATERAQETQALYQLTNRLSDAQSLEDIGAVAVESVSRTFSCQVAFLAFVQGVPEKTFLQYAPGGVVRRELDPRDEVSHRLEYLRDDHVESAEFVEWPVYGREQILGVVRLPREGALLTDHQQQLLRSMLESVAMAIDRLNAAQAQQRYREESRQERYRSNLLRAISHDLRTPLSGIMGTSEMIRDLSQPSDRRYTLAKEIWSDADWLRALVENILSLTRLEDGSLHIHKQPEAVEEIVGSALGQMERRAPEYEIDAELPDALMLVPMDAKLIEQMLINLLDNAVKHTPVGGEIKICVEEKDGLAMFRVLDRGEDIRAEDLPHLFERFYTSQSRRADAKRGIGLGLSICDAIARAHGGCITAKNREGGGAEFTFTLPMEGIQNEQSA